MLVEKLAQDFQALNQKFEMEKIKTSKLAY